MKTIYGSVLAAALIASAPASAAAQPQVATAVQPDEPAKLAEAHAIINIMFPPATRQQMMDKMLSDLVAPMRQSMPIDGITDPGLKALFTEYLDNTLDAQRPLMARHLPAMADAMAVAYAHQFSLAQLKDIHAFAVTPSGSEYFSHVMTVVSDPAIAKVMTDMMADARETMKPAMAAFRQKVVDYLKAHPEAAKQLETMARLQTPGK